MNGQNFEMKHNKGEDQKQQIDIWIANQNRELRMRGDRKKERKKGTKKQGEPPMRY